MRGTYFRYCRQREAEKQHALSSGDENDNTFAFYRYSFVRLQPWKHLLMKLGKILHTYKIYKPEVEGGIPEVIATLAGRDLELSSSILVARKFGFSRTSEINGTHVTAAASLGSLFSMPVSPVYPLVFRKYACQADVVVHHAPFPLTDIAITANFPDHVGLIIFWHAEVVGRKLLRYAAGPFVDQALLRADKIIVSHESMVERSDVLKPHTHKIKIVPFGTDLNFWGTLDEDQSVRMRRISGMHQRLVVFVGRLVEYKGLDILLNAISRIDAQLVIIGDGPLRGKLERLSRSLGISDRVLFYGRLSQSDIKIFLHAAQLLVLPSITVAEAYGLVQMEAMAAGCPIVNTNLPTAVPHIARHDLEGLTVPPKDPVALARACEAIIDNPQLRSRLSSAARARAHSEYSADVFRSRMAEIYDEVMAARAKLQNNAHEDTRSTDI